MRRIILGLFFVTPILLSLLFINTAFRQGNPGFKIDKTQKGLLISEVFKPVNPVKKNDLIIYGNGLSYYEILGYLVLQPTVRMTDIIIVLREGQRLEIPVKTIPHTVFSLLQLIWPRLLLITLFLTLGAVVVYKGPPDHVSMLFFLMLCSFSIVLSVTIPSTIAFLSPFIYSFAFLIHVPFNWIAFGLWIHFALRFPEERDLIQEKWWIPLLIYLIPAITTLGGAFYGAGMSPEFYGWVQRLRNLYLPVIIIGVFIKHATDYRKIKTQQERNRIKLPLIAYWLTFAPYLFLYLLPNLMIDAPLISFRMTVFAFFILPLAYYAGILRYKLFNVDQIISKTIAYFAIIIALSIVYSLFFTLLKKWFFGDAVLSKELFLGFLILMNLIFHPVIVRLDRLIRYLFFLKDGISIKVMHEFSDRITATLDLPRIIDSVTQELPPAINIRSAAVMIFDQTHSRLYPENLHVDSSFGTQSRMVELFKDTTVSHFNIFQATQDPELGKEFREIQNQGFTLVLPLRTSQCLSGLLFIGPKTSGGLFSEADILLLGSFANQSAIALENAIQHESLIKGKRQLEQMFDQKVRAEKMAAIGETTSILAHELKNPLGIIHSSAQYLSQGKQSKNVAREMLRYILEEVDHLNLTINSILNLARQKPPEFSKVDLAKEIQHLIEQWKQAEDHKKEVSIHISVPKPLNQVHADFRQLAQVLLNIFRNSEEMMPKDGRIWVTLTQNSDNTLIQIMDNGPGIPEENLDHIFENFFTTKKQGLGLGLVACRQIIQAHNGSITLTNRTENHQTGTVAEIVLPIDPLINFYPHDFNTIAMPS